VRSIEVVIEDCTRTYDGASRLSSDIPLQRDISRGYRYGGGGIMVLGYQKETHFVTVVHDPTFITGFECHFPSNIAENELCPLFGPFTSKAIIAGFAQSFLGVSHLQMTQRE
jgi:hypothetical protein